MDATMQDASNDAQDGGPGDCTVTVDGTPYSCTALVSYSPTNGLLMTVDASPGMAFGFGVTLASSDNFAPGATYSMPSGAGSHTDGQGVWIYSDSQGYGSAMVSVTSAGQALMQDGGSGEIYFSRAYGDAVIDLAAADPPFATGTVVANLHWVTEVVAPPADAGADASHDASHDAANDGGDANDDADDSGPMEMKSCGVKLTGATTTLGDAGLPCTSSLLYTPDPGVYTLQITESTDGGDDTQITVVIPGGAGGPGSGRSSSSMCTPTGDCGAGVSITQGSGSSEVVWTRTWAASDIGQPDWFNLEFSADGTCPEEGPDYYPCSGYLGSFTATLPPNADGGAPLSLSIAVF